MHTRGNLYFFNMTVRQSYFSYVVYALFAMGRLLRSDLLLASCACVTHVTAVPALGIGENLTLSNGMSLLVAEGAVHHYTAVLRGVIPGATTGTIALRTDVCLVSECVAVRTQVTIAGEMTSAIALAAGLQEETTAFHVAILVAVVASLDSGGSSRSHGW